MFTRKSSRTTIDAPVVGKVWRWEPTWCTGLRFLFGSQYIIKEGYEKFKDTAFVARRLDADFLILSNKYADELKSLPKSDLFAMDTLARSVGGEYTGFDQTMLTDIHVRALQSMANRELTRCHEPLKDELDWAMQSYMPTENDWKAINCRGLVRELSLALMARVFVGPDLCRHYDWRSIGTGFTQDVIKVAYFLRLIPWMPRPLKWLILRLFPAWNSVQKHYAASRRLVRPLVEKYRQSDAQCNSIQDPPTVLKWMSLNSRTEYEADPDIIAHRLVHLGFTADFATLHSIIFLLFDLCKHPEYIGDLREEAENCLLESGCWNRSTLDNMKQIESFMIESQRSSPILMVTFSRTVMKPLTLSDGLHLPKGTRLGMAAQNIMNDPAVTSEPDRFDPWRSLRERQKPGEESKHRFTTTSPNNLHFGHGTQACTGRYLAMTIEKMVVAAILVGWDIRFPKTHSQKTWLSLDDFLFPDFETEIELKRRPVKPGVPPIGISM
ncbi:cytochrome P450 [Xylariaceae sp. FL0255]|nr:cytochrome P450 [Xylariaceae sp. FL0255]